jgi:hypothetical protein
MARKFIHLLILLPMILLVIAVYIPGIKGPYVLDDGENITLNKAVALSTLNLDDLYDATLSNNSGVLKRPIAALSFGLNHYFSGSFENTLPLKLTNLFIHIGNGVLIYVLALMLLGSPVLRQISKDWNRNITAGLIAAAWALHPIQLTSVLYVVQRMNSLSALFVLAGLIVFLHGRRLLGATAANGLPTMYAGIIIGTVLGAGAKENAVLLPLFALTIEYTLFSRGSLSVTIQKKVKLFYAICVLIPFVFFSGYLILHPDFISNGYLERHFTLSERLLTQPRVLWFYLSLVLFPSVHRLGLFHDDISVSHGAFDPFSTLPSLIGILAITIFAIAKARRYPLLAFSILWFIAGHMLESSVFPLEIAYEHRNYLPSFGLLFAVVLSLRVWLEKISNAHTLRYAIPLLLILSLGYSTWSRANIWSDINILAESEVNNHPNSGRANDFAARVNLIHNHNVNKALEYVIRGMHAAPNEAGFYIDLRIYLATLSLEISHALPKNKSGIMEKPSDFKIEGLPNDITVSFENRTLKLSHTSSNGNTIRDILRDKPITVHGVSSLESLSKCILNPPYYCRTLQKDTFVWLMTATNNPRTSSAYRASLFSDIAQLHASNLDLVRAYEYINYARQTAPYRLAYQLGRIEYLIRLGKLDEAKRLLDNYNQLKPGNSIERRANEETIAYLQKMYQESAKEMQGR